MSLDIDVGHFRGVHREASFDPFAGDDSPHGEHFPSSTAATRHYDASVNLDPLFSTFENPRMDVDGVADLKFEGVARRLEFSAALINLCMARVPESAPGARRETV